MLAALSFHVSHHPAYPAMRTYALHCHDVWPVECPDQLPSFEEWRQAAKAVVRSLIDWALDPALAIADQKQMLAALTFHVSHPPAYPAMRTYALHCHDV